MPYLRVGNIDRNDMASGTGAIQRDHDMQGVLAHKAQHQAARVRLILRVAGDNLPRLDNAAHVALGDALFKHAPYRMSTEDERLVVRVGLPTLVWGAHGLPNVTMYSAASSSGIPTTRFTRSSSKAPITTEPRPSATA